MKHTIEEVEHIAPWPGLALTDAEKRQIPEQLSESWTMLPG